MQKLKARTQQGLINLLRNFPIRTELRSQTKTSSFSLLEVQVYAFGILENPFRKKTSSTEDLEGLISQMFYIFVTSYLPNTRQCVSFFTVAKRFLVRKISRSSKGDFSALWLKIKEDLPKSELVYLSCKPSPKRISKWNWYQSLNLKIKELSHSEERLHFVDISKTLLKSDMTFHKGLWKPDNLHLNAAGYTKWSRVVHPWLNLGNKL